MKLRFSIRDLFWLVLVVAVCAAWYLDRLSTEQIRRQHAADEMNIASAHKALWEEHERNQRAFEASEKTIRELYQKLGVNVADPDAKLP